MAVVGALFYALFHFYGHYYVEGVGYATVQALLLGQMPAALYILPMLFLGKLLAISLTLGSGGSGGIFSPSLYMGAMLGGAFGTLVHTIYPLAGATPQTFAIVGMAVACPREVIQVQCYCMASVDAMVGVGERAPPTAGALAHGTMLPLRGTMASGAGGR